MRRAAVLLLAVLAAAPARAAPPIADADTRAWWAITSDLASDAMEGRDTGSAGHARAAAYVAARFKAAGLKPAGVDGAWTQTLQLGETRVEREGTGFVVTAGPGWGDAARVPARYLGARGARIAVRARCTARLSGLLRADRSGAGHARADRGLLWWAAQPTCRTRPSGSRPLKPPRWRG